MKKKLPKIIIASVFAALCFSLTLAAAGCSLSTEKYSGCISEIRDAVYDGENDIYTVTAISGVHETPFAADGVTGDKKDFTIITVKLKDGYALGSRTYTYAVKLDGNEYTGVLTLHPFGDSLSAEIDARTNEPELILNLKQGGAGIEITLKNVVESDDISADRALDTALHALSAELKPLKKAKGFDCEIYVRFIPNPINADGGYYWYVAFLGEKTYAVLLDRKTAEVIGIKD